MKRAIATAILVLTATAQPIAAATGLVCVAPRLESDAKRPLPEVETLEFYFDEGNVAKSYSTDFKRMQSNAGADGKVQNAYSIGEAPSIGATIDFAGDPAAPTSFAVVVLDRIMTSTGLNKEETEFMVDAVPGIACYSVTVKGIMNP